MHDFNEIDVRVNRILVKVRERSMKVGARLSESEVSAFETKYGVSLPIEYRQFLLRIGNEAPGPPSYGIIPLAEPTAEGGHRSHTSAEFESLGKPFPFTRPWIWEDGEKSDEGTDDDIDLGQLYLGTEGCAMDWFLVVTGPDRGSIWLKTGVGITPTTPKRDFLRWFEDWLDGVRDWWS